MMYKKTLSEIDFWPPDCPQWSVVRTKQRKYTLIVALWSWKILRNIKFICFYFYLLFCEFLVAPLHNGRTKIKYGQNLFYRINWSIMKSEYVILLHVMKLFLNIFLFTHFLQSNLVESTHIVLLKSVWKVDKYISNELTKYWAFLKPQNFCENWITGF